MVLQLKIGSEPMEPRVYLCSRGRVHVETSSQRLIMSLAEFRLALKRAGMGAVDGVTTQAQNDTVAAPPRVMEGTPVR